MSSFGNDPDKVVQMPKMPKNMGGKVTLVVLAIIVLWFGSSMVYTVQEQERAAILTFGKFSGQAGPGLRFKMPYPIQQVIKVPSEITQRLEIGYRETGGRVVPVDDEALMITGDENIVSADAIVEWKVSNLEQFLYNIEKPELFLHNAATSAIRSVIGSEKLDFVITDGKTQVQADVKQKLEELNEMYQTGIQILDVKFQDIEPPEGEVQLAFKQVTNAREEKNTKVNNARKYENDIIPKARGEAQAMIENAEAIKKSRILNAQGDVAQFNAVYQEYQNNPSVTENRLILETLEKIYPNARIFITDSAGDTVKYLPLNEMIRGTTQAPKGGTTP